MNIPPDLLELQRAYDQADARCRELADSMPSAVDVVEGRADFTDAQMAELEAARAERLRALAEKDAHPWLASAEHLEQAKVAVREAARAAG